MESDDDEEDNQHSDIHTFYQQTRLDSCKCMHSDQIRIWHYHEAYTFIILAVNIQGGKLYLHIDYFV